ncbi:MAG: nicotinate (nicotinamide) nucleotide adenylyltransferase [Paludibacteraceae bacterium]|nr:nicotinate (nicotinamide) nucleotide adenylyltransferase [Paludibacteraceae bacterium]
MQIGIYGGSFNPVHFGHVGLVKWVAEHTDLDEVWMMVSPNNPLKDSRELADEQVRLAGVQKAIEGIPHVVASDFEFHLPRPSYTANTLRALAAAYPQHTFSLIIGEDNLRILPRWREWEYIVSNYRIFVYPRRGARSGQWAVGSGQLPDNAQIIMLNGAPYFDISSTEIRQLAALGNR